MHKITDRQYKDFFIGDIFNVYTGSLLPKNELRVGNIPRITASETNNGVIGTFAPSAHKNYRALTNFISVSFLGGVFYHPYTASLDMKIHAIQIADGTPLNKYSGAFIVSALKNTVSNYSYGDQLSSTDLPKKRILLPIDSQGNPDWNFMTDYMKQQEQAILTKYKIYLTAIERERERVEATSGRKWAEFSINEIFNIKAGKRLTKASMVSGRTPFIGASDSNNGVTAFISNDNASRDSNILGVNYNGSVVETFYHPYECLFSDDVKRFSLKSYEGNKYIYLFLKSIIIKQKEKYQYGYKFNESRMLRQKIMLPVTDGGEPDYEYMEKSAKYTEAKLLARYVAYLDSRSIPYHK